MPSRAGVSRFDCSAHPPGHGIVAEKPSSPSPDAVVDELLAVVGVVAGSLRAGAAQSDSEGRLVDSSVDILRSRGFWRMRLCSDLGGFELPIVSQVRVLAALAAEDASAAWCTMIANDAVAVIGATMPMATIDRVFAHGVPACSIVAAPGGFATPVDGGYLLNGTWRLATAIHSAAWISAAAFIDRDPSRLLPLAIPADDVTLLDSWDVVGLAGTGSKDFRLADYFLPIALTGREGEPVRQVRGSRRYDLVDVENLESYEHLAFALGIGRRALHEWRLALAKPPAGRYAADREVVQGELGRAVLKLQSIEALAYSLYRRIDAASLGEINVLSRADRHLPRALAVAATELALQCTQLAFHRSGTAAIHRPSILDKLLRDMSVAAKHVVVDDTAFANYAEHLIETGETLGLGDGAPTCGSGR